MEKMVFLYSGQGSQYPGMGRDLCEGNAAAARVYEEASDILGLDVLKLSREGTAEELSKTSIAQPLIFTLSMAVFAVLSQKGLRPQAVAGFSLGECSALVSAGAMSLSTGLRVIRERAQAMQKAADTTQSAMFAILGRDEAAVSVACGEAGGYVTPVNFNCPGQIVIAGEIEAAGRAAEILATGGAKTVRLAVNAAFHSRLMEGAAASFYETIKDLPFTSPELPVYSNVTGDTAQIGNVPDYLKKQMTSPVRFADEMVSMSRDGYHTFVELGPGRTLCGFLRKGIKDARSFNVEDTASADKCLNEFINN